MNAFVSLERKHDFFIRHLPERRGRVLDVGCGVGLPRLGAAPSASIPWYAMVRTFSEPMLAIARRKRAAANMECRRANANGLALEGARLTP